MYPKHVAEFLALTSSLDMSRENNNTNKYDGIEADVNDVFVVERDDDNCYIWFYESYYFCFLLMYVVPLEFQFLAISLCFWVKIFKFRYIRSQKTKNALLRHVRLFYGYSLSYNTASASFLAVNQF